MWEDSRYCWVVLCKNHWFHLRQSLLFRHRIPLAETDAVMPRPPIKGPFLVRCDECGQQYQYEASEVLRFEQDPPDPFTPHPILCEEIARPPSVVAGHKFTPQFSGEAGSKPSPAPAVTQNVRSFSTTTTISEAHSTYGTPTSVTVSVSSSEGIVTGNVVLSVDGGAGSTQDLSDGRAVFPLGVLNAGSHALSASFAPQSNFDLSSALVTLSVAQAPLTVTANDATRSYGASNPDLTGTVLGLQNGDAITARFTTSAAPASPVGTYPIMPVVLDPSNHLSNYAVTLVNGTLNVVLAATSVILEISPLSIVVGQSTTITVTLTVPDLVIPIDPGILAQATVDSPLASDILTNNGTWTVVAGGAPGTASCQVTLAAIEPKSRLLLANFPGTANLAPSASSAELVVTAPFEGEVSCLKSNFLSVTVPGGSHLWFNSNFKIKGVNRQKTTITFFQSSVQFQYRDANNNPVSVNQALPGAKITFDPGASVASTLFDAVHNIWITTVPFDLEDPAFLTGIPWLVPAGGIPADIESVAWYGTFASDTPGVDIGWRWSAAAYSSFNSDLTVLGVKPMNTDDDNARENSDNAGIPENFKAFVIPGARGKGGKNYTGSFSGSAEIV